MSKYDPKAFERFEAMLYDLIDNAHIDCRERNWRAQQAGMAPIRGTFKPALQTHTFPILPGYNFHCSRRTVPSFNPPDQMPTPRIEKHKITVSYSRNARQWGCRIHHGADLIFSTPFQYNRKQDARHAAEHLVINLRAGHFDYAVENARTGTMETMTQIFRP